MIIFSSYAAWWTVLVFLRINCWINLLVYDGGWTSDKALRAYCTSQAVAMDTPGFASLIRVFRNSLCHMKKSNDVSDTEQTFLDSLGVLDLDLSFGPDAFGLKAFGPILYNSLPSNVKESNSMSTFKTRYKRLCFNN